MRAARERQDLHVDAGVERRPDDLERERAAQRGDQAAGDERDQIGLRGDAQGLEVARKVSAIRRSMPWSRNQTSM